MSLQRFGASRSDKAQVHLLLVEDDLVFRRFALASLSQPARPGGLRLKVSTVGSLREALAAVAERTPDCILLDLGLPDSHGLHTLEALTAAAPGLPVVVLTGTEEDELADAALRAGAQDFLEKDQLEPRNLARALRHALDRGAWAAQINAKNRELEDRNRDLDDFAHAVSHDLKAPLRAMFHLIVEAQGDLREGELSRAERTLAGVEPRIRRLSGMIDGLLRLTTAGRLAEATPVDVGRVVGEVLESLPVRQGFVVEVQPGLPVVPGSRTALAQVFQNLIDNAFKHHPGPTGRITVGWRDGADHVEFQVCDDGAGIPEEQRERVFQLFQTLSPGSEGTGIGLALVRKVVQAAGGSVVADANPPRGTCFRVRWPKAPAPAPAPGAPAQPGFGPTAPAAEHKARMVA